MNKLMRSAVVGVFALGVGYSAVAFAAETDFSTNDHKALAALYEKKAAESSALISEHERMIDSNFIRQNPSATVQNEMKQHCSSIVAKAKDLKAEFSSAAAWHRAQ